MLSNCAGKTLESPVDCKEIKSVNPEGNQPWIFIGKTDVEAPILWPPDARSLCTGKTWCWERLRAGGDGTDRRWNSWMASQIQRTWIWKNSRRWWRTGKHGVLQFVGSQTVGNDWATEQQLTNCCQFFYITIYLYLHPISPGLLKHPCPTHRCTCYFLS